MENIYTKDYAEFMEEALQAMVQLPVEGMYHYEIARRRDLYQLFQIQHDG